MREDVADIVRDMVGDPSDRFDEYDDPFYTDPPNCCGTAGSIDCQFARCRYRRTCHEEYAAKRGGRAR